MTPPLSTHPSHDELSRFVQGRLDPHRQAEIEEHVAECAECCEVLRAVPDDTLLGRLKAGDTFAPEPPAAPAPETGVPPELRDHPRYRILRQLGSGGMGVVYKAEHRMMERTVALKVINRRLIKNQTALERFRLEVKAAARLSHPNIVTAHDADQAGDLQMLVMEFVDGISVARQVEKAGPLPVRFACQFARQAALGLQHAHEKGMVHRDIKPQNLMLTRDGRVKILDFGLARYVHEVEPAESTSSSAAGDAAPAQGGLTRDGSTLGTPDYIAPEQVRNARAADIRADIYSLGCTLYFMLAGHSPFPDGSVIEKLMSQLDHEPLDLAVVRSDVPAPLLTVIQRMMAKNPAERFQTPAQVAEALTPFCKADGSRGTVAASSATAMPLANAPTIDVPPGSTPWNTAVQPSYLPSSFAPPRRTPWQQVLSAAKRHRGRVAMAAGLLLLVLVGWATFGAVRSFWPATASRSSSAPSVATPGAKSARILVVMPHDNFWYPDVALVRKAAAYYGATTEVASSSRDPAQPSRQSPWSDFVSVDLLLSEVNPDRYSAVVFTGASPADSFEHLRDRRYAELTQSLIRRMTDQRKPVAAVCLGSRVLADLGFLAGRSAARCPYQPQDAGYESKARWQSRRVVVDGPFITGTDQNTAKEVLQEILSGS